MNKKWKIPSYSVVGRVKLDFLVGASGLTLKPRLGKIDESSQKISTLPQMCNFRLNFFKPPLSDRVFHGLSRDIKKMA